MTRHIHFTLCRFECSFQAQARSPHSCAWLCVTCSSVDWNFFLFYYLCSLAHFMYISTLSIHWFIGAAHSTSSHQRDSRCHGLLGVKKSQSRIFKLYSIYARLKFSSHNSTLSASPFHLSNVAWSSTFFSQRWTFLYFTFSSIFFFSLVSPHSTLLLLHLTSHSPHHTQHFLNENRQRYYTPAVRPKSDSTKC